MKMDYNKILTDEEFMEIKQHGSSAYPFQYYYDNLELFDFHCIEWHWHREFEFLYRISFTGSFLVIEKYE